VLERAAILAPGDTIEIGPDVLAVAPVAAETNSERLVDVERNHLLAVLKQTRWVIDGDAGAAKILDMHPNTLRSRLKKLGLSRPTASHEIS
jgi:formate hydrogenlyase transcriptional activator